MSVARTLVVIINWRQAELTAECVRCVQNMTTPGVEILLIDNGSADNSVDYLSAAFPDIQLIALTENGGFATAANVGLRHAREADFDYALLLNNDAFPAPDMLDKLLAETSDDIALLSPIIYYDGERDRIWFAGGRQDPLLLEMRDSGLNNCSEARWERSRDVDYLLGTGLLVNLAAVDKAGGLDERYFMYYEDLDWSIRLRQAGFRLRAVGSAHLYHRVSISSGGHESPLQKYHLARSSILFFKQHAHLGMPFMIFLFRTASAVRNTVSLLLRGKPRSACAYLRGLLDGWRASVLSM